MRGLRAGLLLVVMAACGDVTEVRGPAGRATAPGAAYEHPDAPLCSDLESYGTVDGPLSADPVIAAAQQWRADNGLRSDAAWVEQVAADPYVEDMAGRELTPLEEDLRLGRTFGHDLTRAEHDELLSRDPERGMLVVQAYTGRFPGTFGGLWIDHSGGGGLTVAFTDDVEGRAAELADLVGPDVHVAVVPARASLRELEALGERMSDLHEQDVAYGSGVRQQAGVYAVGLNVRDEASVQAVLDRAGGLPICVEGPAPSEIIPEGPQPEGGDGWRLLADEIAGGVYQVAAAQAQAEYRVLWDRIGLSGTSPEVDFDDEIILYFGPAVSGSCSNIRLDGVVVDGTTVYPQIVLPGTGNNACTDDANPHAYLVAVGRDRLPERFTLQLAKEGCAGPCDPEEAADVTLRR